MLEVHEISKFYTKDGQTIGALTAVSLTVQPGEFVAVQGPSGCGKTTLLLAAGALLAPDSGTVRLFGSDPYQLTADQRAAMRASTVGFVFQQFHLVPYLSVRDNILSASLGLSAPAPTDRADELIRRFQLEDRLGHYPAELSTGERQRTALARALLNGPRVLLADEPTGNLDRDNAEIVLAFLGEFAAEGGAVLLVTHDDYAADSAQRTVRLEGGRAV